MTTQANKTNFPNLNGLRCIAAVVVVLVHIEHYKRVWGVPNYSLTVISYFADLAVNLFFVLSGFLITYLLLVEKNTTGDISIKDFYVRRIVRIWPLYYLLIFLGMLILPMFHFFDMKELTESIPDNFGIKMLLYLLILPNVVSILFPNVAHIQQTWSIGVEEQFYLFWPWLIKKTTRNMTSLVVVIVVIRLLSIDSMYKPVYLINDVFHFVPSNSHLLFVICNKAALFFSRLNIGYMAIGAIFANLLFFKKQNLLNFFYSKYTWYLTLLVLVITVFYDGGYLNREFHAFLFGIIILNLASDPSKKDFLETPVLHYLGKISYGIYMYHFIAITIALKCVSYFDASVSGVASNIALYLLSLIFVIVIASVSFYTFERFFMNLKHRFHKA